MKTLTVDLNGRTVLVQNLTHKASRERKIKQLGTVLSAIDILSDKRRDLVEALGDEDIARCDNCGKTFHDQGLDPIRHLHMRVDVGGEMPAGQCPSCGALAYRL
ncbi:MAG: hypothetical protein M0036_18950 [Desulfobacteraceae bacterium]|nr:hypothetical protein [Desulfobacteraceae bacterium]